MAFIDFIAFIAMVDGPAPRGERGAHARITWWHPRETGGTVVHRRLELVHLNLNGDGDDGHGLVWQSVRRTCHSGMINVPIDLRESATSAMTAEWSEIPRL